MGKGDKKTKRGKIIMGSHGVSRPKRKPSRPVQAPVKEKAVISPEKKPKTKKEEPPIVEPVEIVVEETAKPKKKAAAPKAKKTAKPKEKVAEKGTEPEPNAGS